MQSSGSEVHVYLEISTCDPLNIEETIPSLLHFSVWDNPSEYKGSIY